MSKKRSVASSLTSLIIILTVLLGSIFVYFNYLKAPFKITVENMQISLITFPVSVIKIQASKDLIINDVKVNNLECKHPYNAINLFPLNIQKNKDISIPVVKSLTQPCNIKSIQIETSLGDWKFNY